MRLVLRVAASLGVGFVATVAIAWLGAAYEEEPGRGSSLLTKAPIPEAWTFERMRRVLATPRGYEYAFDDQGLVARGRLVTRERIFMQLVPRQQRGTGVMAPADEREGSGGLGVGFDEPGKGQADDGAASGEAGDGPMRPPTPGRFGEVLLTGRAADRYKAGWPLRALEWSDPVLRVELGPMRGNTKRSALQDAWHFGTGYSDMRTRAWGLSENWRGLPIRPVGWGEGLIVDTLVWGAVAGAAMFGPGVVKRLRRRRQGMCAACGYPLVDSSGRALGRCPECGARREGELEHPPRDQGAVGAALRGDADAAAGND